MESMKVGIVGLGKMGLSIAYRLIHSGHEVFGFDRDIRTHTAAKTIGVFVVSRAQDIPLHARIVWLMVTAGTPVDDVLSELKKTWQINDIIIDGGNSFFKDSIRRQEQLLTKKIHFMDCGTSGGLYGKEHGFALMVGGDRAIYEQLTSIFEAVSAPEACMYCGATGAGHFVKMVHNGIEYALLQAYAEGFHVLKNGPYKQLNLEKVASTWNHGAVVRSWILELVQKIMAQDQDFKNISGSVGENLTGLWMIQVASDLKVPARVIEQALAARAWSRQTGGNYATKLVALLRHEFGGHEIHQEKKK
jgi:6-phosphogluconate dehydrogenase